MIILNNSLKTRVNLNHILMYHKYENSLVILINNTKFDLYYSDSKKLDSDILTLDEILK